MDRTLVFGFNLEKDKCIDQDRKLKVHIVWARQEERQDISLMFKQL